jgi:hypothetical protein
MTKESAPLDIRREDGLIVLEPPTIHGVRGFSIHLTPEQSTELGQKLVQMGQEEVKTA